jgi:hypothetical protein
MKPVARVAVVALVVVVVVLIMRHYMNTEQEGFVGWFDQEFETVAPRPAFSVTPSALVVNGELTAAPTALPTEAPPLVFTPPQQDAALVPVMTQISTQLPAAMPTMVPTFVPTAIPSLSVAPGVVM